MRRVAEEHLTQWWDKKDRMPLIIRGARQVGKSTLVRQFCKTHKLDLIELNFELIKLNTLQENDFVLQDVIDEIQLKTKKQITKNTLLFLDEIQEVPRLLKGLRYFYENRPEIAVVSAGSLLEITIRDEQFSFPVGRVEFYHLGPMNFVEYLWATNNQFLLDKLEKLKFSTAVHEQAKIELQKFYYTGGMPKAVLTYVETKSLATVRDIQNQIIQTYLADFPKYNNRIKVERIERVFKACALKLGEKIIYQQLDPVAKSRDIKRIVELLIDARVLLKCQHSDANDIPLVGESDSSVFKLYFLDIGLFNTLLNLDLDAIDVEFKNNFNTKGALAEQFVAQHLAYSGNPAQPPSLFYWLRDRGSQKGEIDFLIAEKSNIIPVEVKATKSGHLKSLFYFIKEKHKKLAVKISLDVYSVLNIQHKINSNYVKGVLINTPQYAVCQIAKILKLDQLK